MTDSKKTQRSGFAARVNRTQLNNGATLLTLENRATPIITLRGSVRAGGYFEPPDKPALASIVAEMLERGTNQRTKLDIARELESVGAMLGFGANQFAVVFSGRALKKDTVRVLRALAEMLRQPSLPVEELEKLKQQTISAIREQQTQTGYRARQKLAEVLFPREHPFYLTPADELMTTISALTVEDCREFYERQYGGNSLILAMAGDLDTAEIEQEFAAAFGDFAAAENTEVNVPDVAIPSESRRVYVPMKDKASVDVLMGLPAPILRSSPDYYAATLANSALGESTLSSRLGLQVRDKEGLTYGIGSRFASPSLAAGAWYIAVSVNAANIERAIESSLAVLDEYVADGIRDEELADEKSAAVGSLKVGLSTNNGLASVLWLSEFHELGLDYVDRYPDIINSTSKEAVNAAIKKYFNRDALTFVMAGEIKEPSAD